MRNLKAIVIKLVFTACVAGAWGREPTEYRRGSICFHRENHGAQHQLTGKYIFQFWYLKKMNYGLIIVLFHLMSLSFKKQTLLTTEIWLFWKPVYSYQDLVARHEIVLFPTA